MTRLRLTGTTTIVSQDEKLRYDIRTSLKPMENKVHALLERGKDQVRALRLTIFAIGMVLHGIKKVVEEKAYPGGWKRYLQDARAVINIPKASVDRYVANFQQVQRLELPDSFLHKADAAHIDLASDRNLRILESQIPSEMKKLDEESFVQLFTKRNPASHLSQPLLVSDIPGWAGKAVDNAMTVLHRYREKEGVTPATVAAAARAAGEALIRAGDRFQDESQDESQEGSQDESKEGR